MTIKDHRRRMDFLLAERRLAEEEVRREKAALAEARSRHEAAAKAGELVQAVAQAVQTEAHKRIARIVTKCLRTVFAYDFRIDFRRARGKTEARLLFVKDGIEREPLGSAGGGAVDLASFSLRLACLMLAQPQRRRLLVLDEPARMLSRNHGEAFAEMMTSLARELEVQFILVTHDPTMQVGKVIQI